MQIPRVSREPPVVALAGRTLYTPATWILDLTLLVGTVFGAALAALPATLHSEFTQQKSGTKKPDKESAPIPSRRPEGYLLGLELALPASGVTIARESALDLGPKLGLHRGGVTRRRRRRH